MRRQGFTLLELLLAAVLTAVLMAGIWALLGTYEGLVAQGQAKAEHSQLLRTLMEQLSDDLRSAIPDSATGMPGASSSVRRFGLFGTDRALQVDVLQVTPDQCVAALGASGELIASSSAQVPELHTVQYAMEGSSDSELEALAELELESLATPKGLVRRELDWETPGEEDAADSLDPMSVGALAVDPDDETTLFVPEVTDLRFRYYDGSSWASQWNSLERKSLPVAIEVQLTIALEGDPKPPADEAEAEAEAEEELLAELLGEAPTAAKPATGQTHRLLVCLPATSLAPPIKEEDDLSSLFGPLPPPEVPEYRPVLPPAPPTVPSPPPSESTQSKTLEELLRDQWMRNRR